SRERELADKIADGIKEAMGQIQATIKGMTPVDVDASGLMAALAGLAARTSQGSRAACRFICAKPVLLPGNQAATDLYKIAQEAVTNALKHAYAPEITHTPTDT